MNFLKRGWSESVKDHKNTMNTNNTINSTFTVTDLDRSVTVEVDARNEESAARKAASLILGRHQRGDIKWHGTHFTVGGHGRLSMPKKRR